MSTKVTKPIGEMLTEAGLISDGQLQTALYDQQIYQDMRLGEILASRGWLPQATVDFFGEMLQSNQIKHVKMLLGECFLNAALVDQQQINNVLEEQRINHLRFGAIAVLKGYVSQTTLNFFLKHLNNPQSAGKDYLKQNTELTRKTFSQRHQEAATQEITFGDDETIILKATDAAPIQTKDLPSHHRKPERQEINWI